MLTDGTITLRAPEPRDIDRMYLWENDSSIWIDGNTRAPMSHKLLHDFVEFYNPDPYVTSQLRLIIELNVTGEPVGSIDLYEFDGINRRSGVGIVIDPSFRRRGYASRSINLLSRYCHEHLGLHQIWAIVNRNNADSTHLFERCGFRTCGSLKSWIRKGDSYYDALMYQRLLTCCSPTTKE